MSFLGVHLLALLALLFLNGLTVEQADGKETELGGLCYLTWTANSEPDLAGYNLYYGSTPELMDGKLSPIEYGKDVTIAECPERHTAKLGLRYFTLTAFDTFGNESDPHEAMVNSVVPNVAPPQPTAVAYGFKPFIPFHIDANYKLHKAVIVVAKPTRLVLSSTITMLVWDPDFSDEGKLIINGTHTIPLFGPHKVDIDEATVSINFQVPSEVWRHGENTLEFRHLRTNQGYKILEIGQVVFW